MHRQLRALSYGPHETWPVRRRERLRIIVAWVVMMVKILREGVIPQGRNPWPFNEYDVLTCPVCDTRFRIEEEDTKPWYSGDGQVRKDPKWTVRRERSPNGKQEASGPCPFCKQGVTIRKERAAVAAMEGGEG